MNTPTTAATPAVAVTESFVAVEVPLASPPQSPRTLVATAPLPDSVIGADSFVTSVRELSSTAAAEVTATKAMTMSARTIIWRAIFW
ncbi:hypothetical protein HanPSC8_Chr15g0681191 [Helianthus annuus]|nr:hypothetical protein HanPSC8_Chr15g0681191 [Helianthus annuus]